MMVMMVMMVKRRRMMSDIDILIVFCRTFYNNHTVSFFTRTLKLHGI